MSMMKSINVPNDAKHAIANGIFTAITHDIPDRIRDDDLPTTVGVGQFRWNYIHKRVTQNLGGRFQVKYAPRCSWKILLLFEQAIGFTFSIMSEKNFIKLQERLPKGIHYLESLISKNTGFEAIEGQMRLEGCDFQRDASAISTLREKLLSDFTGIIKHHILILFDYDFKGVTSARAVLVNPNLEVAYSEDWSDFLKTPYVIGKASILEEMIIDDEEPLIKLKPKNSSSNVLVMFSEKDNKLIS